MSNEDFIMETISDILLSDADMPEDGYFRNIDEKAYRCEAIREIFCGLRRPGQDKVLRFAMELLIGQNGPKIEIRDEIISKEAV